MTAVTQRNEARAALGDRPHGVVQSLLDAQDLARDRKPGTALERVTEIGERHLESGERGEDSEAIVVAEVRDAEDLALPLLLPACDRDAVAVSSSEIADVPAQKHRVCAHRRE